MQMKSNKKLLSLILSMMLIVAMAFCTTACGDDNMESPSMGTEGQNVSGGDYAQGDVQGESGTQAERTVLGEGEMVFTFIVVDGKGKETVFEIHTDQTTVGDALLELGLIAGEKQAYGLYVKTVNGITIDYDKDKKYWAFYINDGYAVAGVDATPITEGEVYSFKVE